MKTKARLETIAKGAGSSEVPVVLRVVGGIDRAKLGQRDLQHQVAFADGGDQPGDPLGGLVVGVS